MIETTKEVLKLEALIGKNPFERILPKVGAWLLLIFISQQLLFMWMKANHCHLRCTGVCVWPRAGWWAGWETMQQCLAQCGGISGTIARLLRMHKYCSLSYSHLMATRKQSSEGEERDMR